MSDPKSDGRPNPVESNPLHSAIAENVRSDSRMLLRPTRLELLGDQDQPLEAPATRGLLDEMKSLPEYADIDYLETTDGSVHAYSTQFINRQLASVCAVASVGDHAATLAQTIREESRLYPRPTAATRFRDPPWSMTSTEIEDGIRDLERSQEYVDIRRTSASNGDLYLFSERFLNPDVAAGMAEWDAVERDLNP